MSDTKLQETRGSVQDLRVELSEVQIWKLAHAELRDLQAEFALCYDPDKETLMQAFKRILKERDAAKAELAKLRDLLPGVIGLIAQERDIEFFLNGKSEKWIHLSIEHDHLKEVMEGKV